MTPLIQTILDTGDASAPGNCLQTAVASLLDLPLEEVPHFVLNEAMGGPAWFDGLLAFAKESGLRVEPLWDKNPAEPDEHYLAFGHTVRGTYHAVVHLNGQLAHDPHPSGAGLLAEGARYALRVGELP